MAFCDCNGRRIPTKWKVTISGVTNNGCSDCNGIDGDYYPEQVGTSCSDFSVSVTGGSCGLSAVEVDVLDTSGMMTLTVTFRTTNDTAIYTVTGVRDPLAGEIKLSALGGGSDCNWPDEITLLAIGPDISELKSATCLAAPFPPVIPPYAGVDAIPGEIPAYQVPTGIPSYTPGRVGATSGVANYTPQSWPAPPQGSFGSTVSSQSSAPVPWSCYPGVGGMTCTPITQCPTGDPKGSVSAEQLGGLGPSGGGSSGGGSSGGGSSGGGSSGGGSSGVCCPGPPNGGGGGGG